MHRAPFPVLAANLFYEGTEIPFAQPSTILATARFQCSGARLRKNRPRTADCPPVETDGLPLECVLEGRYIKAA